MFEVAFAGLLFFGALILAWAIRAFFLAPVAALVWWAVPALGGPVVPFLPVLAVLFVLSMLFGGRHESA